MGRLTDYVKMTNPSVFITNMAASAAGLVVMCGRGETYDAMATLGQAADPLIFKRIAYEHLS